MDIIQSFKDRESRSTRRIVAFLSRQDGREVRALVTNVSNRGCQLMPNELLKVDEFVRIEVPRVGSVAATIRWTADGKAGAEFIPQSDIWEEVAEPSLAAPRAIGPADRPEAAGGCGPSLRIPSIWNYK